MHAIATDTKSASPGEALGELVLLLPLVAVGLDALAVLVLAHLLAALLDQRTHAV